MDVGSALRQAREQRGLSLRQLSQTTKISLGILRAIESNDLARLPEAVFTRGFLNAYAREVGLDPRDIIERYSAWVAEGTIAERGSSLPPRAGDLEALDSGEPATDNGFRRAATIVALAGALVLAIVLASYLAPGTPSDARDEAAQGQDAGTGIDAPPAAAPASPAPVGVATAGSTETAGPRGSDDLMHLDVRSHGLCWLEATADGRRLAYRLMVAGERVVIEARSEIVLRVGEPSSLTFSINGAPGRSLGRAGAPVTVRITKENYRAFVEP